MKKRAHAVVTVAAEVSFAWLDDFDDLAGAESDVEGALLMDLADVGADHEDLDVKRWWVEDIEVSSIEDIGE